MTWRVEVRPTQVHQDPATGKWEGVLVAVWEGPGEPPEREPDVVKLNLREPAPVPYLDN